MAGRNLAAPPSIWKLDFSNWSLTRRVEAVIALLWIPALLIVGVQLIQARQVLVALKVRDQNRQLMLLVSDVRTALLNIETGQRGYALSTNQEFLEPYLTGRAALTTALASLAHERLYQGQIQNLSGAIQAYLRDWVEPNIARVKRNQVLPRAELQRLLSDGKQRFDLLRAEVNSLGDMTQASFEQTRLESQNIAQLVALVPWLMFALVLTGGILMWLGLRRLVVQPLERLSAATARLTDGDYAVRLEVTSHDELGEMANRFNIMTAALQAHSQELQRSNRELEQFAYVASHDLQEPLRMVASYTQLLQRRYQDKLDDKAAQYIHFAVDGAERMQRLIQDLLAFSRVGTRAAELRPTDSALIVQDVLRSLELALTESGAQVKVGALPVVLTDATQLAQVFLNLIGNAIKFRRPGVAPLITVEAQPYREGMWCFQVQDNGLGIEADYFERIFVIFQRLHNKTEYPGSGIGLAVVRKIIERHGGRIWLKSQPGQGSCFYFTLKAVEVGQ